MKYIIIAAHFDDEFIGCHQFIRKYNKDITQFIYFTDSSLQANYMDNTTDNYVIKRAIESERYVKSWITEKTKTTYLNLPDGLSRKEYKEKCFPTFCIDNWINKQLLEHITNECILYPSLDSLHPSHVWCNSACVRFISDNLLDSISYATHSLFNQDKTICNYNDNQFGRHGETNPMYLYKHPNGLKQQLFMEYFPSQANRMLSCGLKLNDYERYYTDLEISL